MGKRRRELSRNHSRRSIRTRSLVSVGRTFLNGHEVAFVIFLGIIETIELAEWHAFGADEIVVTVDLLLLFIVHFRTPMAPLFLIWTRDLPREPLLIFLVYGPDGVIFVPDLNALDTFAEVRILNAKILLVLLVAVLTEAGHSGSVFRELVPGSENPLHFQQGLDFAHLFVDPLLFGFLFLQFLEDGEAFLLDADLLHLPHDCTLPKRLSLECPKIFPDQKLLVISEGQVLDVATLLESMDLLLLQIVEMLEPIDVVFARRFVILTNLLLVQVLLNLFLEVQKLLVFLVWRYGFHLTSGNVGLVFFLLLRHDEFVFWMSLLYGHVASWSRWFLPRILPGLIILVVTFL